MNAGSRRMKRRGSLRSTGSGRLKKSGKPQYQKDDKKNGPSWCEKVGGIEETREELEGLTGKKRVVEEGKHRSE